MYAMVKYLSLIIAVSGMACASTRAMEISTWHRATYGGVGTALGSIALRSGSNVLDCLAYACSHPLWYNVSAGTPVAFIASGATAATSAAAALFITKAVQAKQIKYPEKYIIPVGKLALGSAILGGTLCSFLAHDTFHDSIASIGLKGSCAFLGGLLALHGGKDVYQNIKEGN